MHAEERQRECSLRHCSEVRAGRLSGLFKLRAYRTVQTRPFSSRSVSQTSILYPVPSAVAQTAPNGVKERASFCLVFRSLNTTSSHRMFSMGYRRAKSTQGNTNFQKEFFGKQLRDHYPRALNSKTASKPTIFSTLLHKTGISVFLPNVTSGNTVFHRNR